MTNYKRRPYYCICLHNVDSSDSETSRDDENYETIWSPPKTSTKRFKSMNTRKPTDSRKESENIVTNIIHDLIDDVITEGNIDVSLNNAVDERKNSEGDMDGYSTDGNDMEFDVTLDTTPDISFFDDF